MGTNRERGEAARGVLGLVRAGAMAGRTDRELLETYLDRGGDAADLAFSTLVDRHGPLVFRAALAVLGDQHDARDASQATFLILSRRAATLRVGPSVAPWLHRVARRAAIRLRRDSDRRRAVERRAAAPALARSDRPGLDDAGAVLEEVDRLPERFRRPVVLCDLEGRTVEEAARHLGCPVGTVKSRLSRARERLRVRLIRRGLAPSALPCGLRPAVPEALARLARGGVTSGVAGGIAAGVIRTMVWTAWGTSMMLWTFGLAIGFGLAARVGGFSPSQDPPAVPAPPPPPPRAWQRVDRYDPPDFGRFFPRDRDREGGRALDRFWGREDRDAVPAAEALPIVRSGLGTAGVEMKEVLAWVGQRFVCNASPQDPDAIELLYHATDPTAQIDFGDAPSLSYGLIRVDPKPPAVLHAMVDWCMKVEVPADWARIGHSTAGQRDDLLAYLKPYETADAEATRDRAALVRLYLAESPEADPEFGRWKVRSVRAKGGHLLPGLLGSLRDGDNTAKVWALRRIKADRLDLILDEPFLGPLAACAAIDNFSIKAELIDVLAGPGLLAIPGVGEEVVDLLIGLSRDANPQIAWQAASRGLIPIPAPGHDRAARRLVEVAIAGNPYDREDLERRIAEALEADRDLAAAVLDGAIRGPDPARAKGALAVYGAMTGRTPPGARAEADPATRRGYALAVRDLHDHLGRVYPGFGIKGIDWAAVGREILPRADALATEEEFGRLVLELVARLEDSHAAVEAGSATPPYPRDPSWDAGLASLLDDRGRPVIYTADPRTAAYRAGVRNGMTVLAVNGMPAAEAMDAWMRQARRFAGYSSARYLEYTAALHFHRQAEKGAKLTLDLEGVDGSKRTVDLRAEVRGWYVPRLPVPVPGIEDGGADVQWARRADGLGYLFVRRIGPGLEAGLDRALAALGDVPGLILDVRGNSGGGFDADRAFRNFDLAAANDHRPLYRGPIACLIDSRCISAGEGWTSWFVARRRARSFGSTTAGASARKEPYTLTNGLYRVIVPVKAYAGFLDRPIERRGIEPDVPVRCTARDLAGGRDTVAEAAADWLHRVKPR